MFLLRVCVESDGAIQSTPCSHKDRLFKKYASLTKVCILITWPCRQINFLPENQSEPLSTVYSFNFCEENAFFGDVRLTLIQGIEVGTRGPSRRPAPFSELWMWLAWILLWNLPLTNFSAKMSSTLLQKLELVAELYPKFKIMHSQILLETSEVRPKSWCLKISMRNMDPNLFDYDCTRELLVSPNAGVVKSQIANHMELSTYNNDRVVEVVESRLFEGSHVVSIEELSLP